MALGVDLRVALYVFSLLQVAFAVAGWILVCDFLFGKNPVRRAVVLLLHAATFLHLAWLESHLFFLQIIGLWHYGAWACVPWLLWLSLRALDGSKRGALPQYMALTGALAVATASDLLIVSWFVAPAALAAVFSSRPKAAAIFIAALGAGSPVGAGNLLRPDF